MVGGVLAVSCGGGASCGYLHIFKHRDLGLPPYLPAPSILLSSPSSSPKLIGGSSITTTTTITMIVEGLNSMQNTPCQHCPHISVDEGSGGDIIVFVTVRSSLPITVRHYKYHGVGKGGRTLLIMFLTLLYLLVG